jgi:hypothetical protein
MNKQWLDFICVVVCRNDLPKCVSAIDSPFFITSIEFLHYMSKSYLSAVNDRRVHLHYHTFKPPHLHTDVFKFRLFGNHFISLIHLVDSNASKQTSCYH